MADKQARRAHWQQAVEWIEAELLGRVINARPQGRWRSAWFFDLQQGEAKVPLYFRGLRPGLGNSSKLIVREAEVLRILERHGVKVPGVLGVCPQPPGIVMQRCPGRPNLATAETPAEGEAVLDQYVDELVKMHGIDTAEFVGIGLPQLTSAEQLALGDLAVWEGTYRRQKQRPEPTIEFALAWLKSNQPRNRKRCVFLHADSGQFIFERGRLTALLDFELSYLGDPSADLAGLRTRDISEPLGDLRRAYRRYEEQTGEPIDRRVVDYHTARFALVTPLATAHVCAKPPPRLNLPQYLGWYLVYTRICLTLIAELAGVTLQPPALPRRMTSRHGASWQTLASLLDGIAEDCEDSTLHYELDTASRLVTQLQRIDGLGEQLEREDWQERVALLGYEPGSWEESERALEARVRAADVNDSADLLNYLYRHVIRQLHLLGPALREMADTVLQNPW